MPLAQRRVILMQYKVYMLLAIIYSLEYNTIIKYLTRDSLEGLCS